jgi:iron complex outermembrane recepter protein
VNSVTRAARDFITEATTDYQRLEQNVVTLSFSGDSAPLFNLPGGAVQYAFGSEYREEKSSSNFSALERGLLPTGSAAGAAGTFIGDIVPDLQSLIFDGSTRTFDTRGSFDVTEYFAEVSAPLVRGAFLAEELTVGAAARYADYSTIGSATTWNVNAVWAPVTDLRLRATYSEAIRAPNLAELFDPQQGTTFRPADPCEQTTINSLIQANDPAAQNRLRNCRAAGIPAGFADPLSARFSGTTGGNPTLQEEVATTYTIGAVIQPRWIPNLTVSVDYYSIEIEDAIDAVAAQDIVNTCYDLPTFPNPFCSLFTRNTNASSPQFRGLNFLRQTQINFGRIETSGVDFQVNYRFDLLGYRINTGLTGNWTEKVNRFFDPVDQSLSNPGLLETGAPDWTGVVTLGVNRGPATLNYNGQIIGRQAIASAVQIERIDTEFGRGVLAEPLLVHNLSGNWKLDSGVELYGGVNNLSDEKPYAPFRAFPVSGMGRFYFAGVRAKF